MVYFITMNANRQVFGHFTFFHCFNTNRFQRIGKIDQRLVVIQFTTEGQAPGPCKNAGNRVGARWISF